MCRQILGNGFLTTQAKASTLHPEYKLLKAFLKLVFVADGLFN
jgi:hypothetical protein